MNLFEISELISKNLILKITAPTLSGKTTILPRYLGEKYQVVVVVNKNNKIDNFKNVTYISSKDFLKNPIFTDILIVDEIDSGSFQNFLIISLWKRSNNKTKLILNSNLPHNLFPDFPNYTFKENNFTEIRYTEENFIDLIYNVYNTLKGNFIVYTKDIKKVTESLRSLLNKERKILITNDFNISLDNVTCIFDTMLEKRMVLTMCEGYQIKTEFISKRDATLRASRTKNGIVYRFISKEKYDSLPEITEEALFRMPLHHVMLDIYQYGMNPLEVLDFKGLEKEKLLFFNTLFYNYFLIDVNSKITEKGKLVRKMNLGLRNSLMCLEDPNSIILAALIDNWNPDIFKVEEFEKEVNYEVDYEVDFQKHKRTLIQYYAGKSDVDTLLNIYNGDSQYINEQYLKDVQKSIDKTKKVINLGYGYPNFKVLEKIYTDKILYLKEEESIYTQYTDGKEVYKISVDSVNLIEFERPLKIYNLISFSLDSTLNIVSLCYTDSRNEKEEHEYIHF